jgi:hypothetical protein
MDDAWHRIGSNVYQILRDDAAVATHGVATNTSTSTWAGSFLPTLAGGAAAAGINCNFIGEVSSEIVAGASGSYDGTKYIQVGHVSRLRAKNVANAAVDARYSGRVTAAITLDPDHAPLQGKTLAQILAESQMENPVIRTRQYLITENGLFVPLDAEGSFAEPVSEIRVPSFPLMPTAYDWEAVDSNLSVPADWVVACATTAFIIEAPAGTVFEMEDTYLWQIQAFGSHKVPDSGHWDTALQKYIPGNLGGYLGAGGELTYGQMHGSGAAFVQEPACNHSQTPPTTKRKAKRKLPAALHRGSVSPALRSLGAHVTRYPGMKIHPALPALAVTSEAAKQPGIHRMMLEDPAGLSNIMNNSVAQAAAKYGPAAIDVAMEHLANPPKQGWSFGSILSGIWDVAKVVGPAIMALI